MSDLFDTLFPSDSETPHPSRHAFAGALREYVAGTFSRNQIISKLQTYGLDSTGESNINAVFDTIDGQLNVSAKIKWILEFEGTMYLVECGWYYTSKQDFRDRFEF